MGRRTFHVRLEIVSNMDGDPDLDVERKLIKSYLEGLNGVGTVEVREILPAKARMTSAEIPLPPLSESVLGEPPTEPRRKRKG